MIIFICIPPSVSQSLWPRAFAGAALSVPGSLFSPSLLSASFLRLRPSVLPPGSLPRLTEVPLPEAHLVGHAHPWAAVGLPSTGARVWLPCLLCLLVSSPSWTSPLTSLCLDVLVHWTHQCLNALRLKREDVDKELRIHLTHGEHTVQETVVFT